MVTFRFVRSFESTLQHLCGILCLTHQLNGIWKSTKIMALRDAQKEASCAMSDKLPAYRRLAKRSARRIRQAGSLSDILRRPSRDALDPPSHSFGPHSISAPVLRAASDHGPGSAAGSGLEA